MEKSAKASKTRPVFPAMELRYARFFNEKSIPTTEQKIKVGFSFNLPLAFKHKLTFGLEREILHLFTPVLFTISSFMAIVGLVATAENGRNDANR